jgi:serine/threonine protein kinase
MINCDTCGEPIEPDHPFRVCPECLFKEALTAGPPEDAAGAEPAFLTVPTGGVVPRLVVRRDFLERYEFLEHLKQGGQGDLWKVWDFQFRRVVAMKCLAAGAMRSDPAFYRFIAEAQIASQLEHPGVLPIFDAGLDPDGRPFYTTQLLPGITFEDIWQKASNGTSSEWPIHRVLEMILRVCDVMAHAHSRGVIHRDLKPSNILVGAFGDVRVIDWGSAHVLRTGAPPLEEPFVMVNSAPVQTDREKAIRDDPDSSLSTGASGLPMTVLFTAPELLRGEKEVIGPQTDVYSLGVMLYELLAGRPPYADKNGKLPQVEQLKELIKNGPSAPVRKVNSKASRDLAAICDKAMAHERIHRYPTMERLAEDVRAVLELRPVQARRPGPTLKALRFAQRHAGYVLLLCLIAMLVAVGSSISGRLRRQRDVALQVQSLRDGELAGRNGHWREALHYWDEAEAAGYNDAIWLGLQRAEAWTVLNEPYRAAAELNKLMGRSDLATRRGTVLLRTGEHELFDKSTAAEGAEHIRLALTAELNQAERCLAQGLLAESATNALALLQQALRLDPYSHAAHRHSLGLEFFLGHHEELAAHIHVFEILYPDDPSPRYLEAAEIALAGRLQDATAALEPIRGSMEAAAWDQQVAGLRLMAEAAHYYSVDVFLKDGTFDSMKLSQLMTDAGFALSGNFSGSANKALPLRTPHLPCIEHGILDGVAALQILGTPFVNDIAPSIQRIRGSWAMYPEALVPFRAATLLQARQPRTGPKSIPLLAIEADLFQMAADSPSVLPGLQRSSRYLAAKAQSELIGNQPDDSSVARRSCSQNIQAAAADAELSAAECRAYLAMAIQLSDFDTAHQLLDRWDKLAPDDPDLAHHRIELEMAAGNFTGALRIIDGVLTRAPADSWARDRRKAVLQEIKAFVETATSTNKSREVPGAVQ